MKSRALRALQVVSAAPIFVLGAALVWLCRDQGGAQACALGLMATALLGLAISELAFAGRLDAIAKLGDGKRPTIDNEIDVAIDRICGAIRRHIGANDDYRRDLDGINEELARFPPRAEVREILVELMNSNFEMQAKVVKLSRELAASQLQIVSLRGNISEVGKIAYLDALTGLGNRRSFDEALSKEIAKARASGEALCLAMADLDRFKSVNDRFGHVVGDHLLRIFGEMLGRRVEGKGLAARYGGEEFAVLLSKTSVGEAKQLIDGLRREMESSQWVVGSKQQPLGAITASFGIARLRPEETTEDFVSRADAKLLLAKTSGRDRVVVDDSDMLVAFAN